MSRTLTDKIEKSHVVICNTARLLKKNENRGLEVKAPVWLHFFFFK